MALKILDKYLLKTFLGTFLTVFIILFFIFILQIVWLFIAELAGKDLDIVLILKFLLFKLPSLVPMVLPLSILLSSIMTFGGLSENYELAAMKSAGISLKRALKSLTIFILLLSVVSFFFANNVIPYSEFKFQNFRRNIAQVKPAMIIGQGQFSEVGNYTIKVDKKSGEKGQFLTGVTIHKKSENGDGCNTIIRSKTGELVSSETSNTLKLVLRDGNYYEEIVPQNLVERMRLPFAKATFKKDIINIDLSKLNQANMNNVQISNTDAMLNVNELRFTLDSLNKNYKKDLISYSDNIYQRSGISSTMYNFNKPKATTNNSFDLQKTFNAKTASEKTQILSIAKSNIENTGFSIDSSVIELEYKVKNINSHWVALFEKFMIAYSCLLMFFIGAPLGAIIRKGGLGLPIVFAVMIFITFHFINTFSKRLAQENGTNPFFGAWMSSIVLTPLAILLTYRATNDIGGMINFDAIIEPVQRFFQRIFTAKTKKNVIQ